MIWFEVGLLIVTAVLFWIHRSYRLEYVTETYKKERKYFFCFSLWIWDKYGRRCNPAVKAHLKQLHPAGHEIHDIEHYYVEKISLALKLFIAICLVTLLAAVKYSALDPIVDSYFLKRKEAGEGTVSYVLEYTVDETSGHGEIEVPVEEQRLSGEETEELFQRVKSYLDLVILAENPAFDQIETDLFLPDSVPDEPVHIQWLPDNYEVLESDGKVHNEELAQSFVTSVTARMVYEDIQTDYEIPLVILPRSLSREESIQKNLEDKIDHENAQRDHTLFCLPDSIDGMPLIWSLKNNYLPEKIFLMGIIGMIALSIYKDRNLRETIKKRNRQMEADYPQVVYKFVLLIGAGLTARMAWERIVSDYERQGGRRYVYEEMLASKREFSTGKSEIQVYESFGMRCKSQNYLKFSSLIIQHVKKGGRGMEALLQEEGRSALHKRREAAKCLGEEAGTKLLMPMMLMFIIVLILIVVPAFLSIGL